MLDLRSEFEIFIGVSRLEVFAQVSGLDGSVGADPASEHPAGMRFGRVVPDLAHLGGAKPAMWTFEGAEVVVPSFAVPLKLAPVDEGAAAVCALVWPFVRMPGHNVRPEESGLRRFVVAEFAAEGLHFGVVGDDVSLEVASGDGFVVAEVASEGPLRRMSRHDVLPQMPWCDAGVVTLVARVRPVVGVFVLHVAFESTASRRGVLTVFASVRLDFRMSEHYMPLEVGNYSSLVVAVRTRQRLVFIVLDHNMPL